jgi:hypothetical protein
VTSSQAAINSHMASYGSSLSASAAASSGPSPGNTQWILYYHFEAVVRIRTIIVRILVRLFQNFRILILTIKSYTFYYANLQQKVYIGQFLKTRIRLGPGRPDPTKKLRIRPDLQHCFEVLQLRF